MPTGTLHRSRLLVAFVLAGVGAACSAGATTYTYDFTANPADAVTSTGRGGSYNDYYVQNTLFLTNTATGTIEVPAITLNTGDTVNGTISLSTPWTIPISNWGDFVEVSLQSLDDIHTFSISTNQAVSFFDNGVQVAPPAGFDVDDNSGGALVIGGVDTSPTTAPFTFDQIDFSGTMTSALGPGFQEINSAPLDSANPALILFTYPASVPSPATPWLMLPGLLGIWATTRRRGRGVAKPASLRYQ
jgi:hypothetical protein